jgi:hypothetical protein
MSDVITLSKIRNVSSLTRRFPRFLLPAGDNSRSAHRAAGLSKGVPLTASRNFLAMAGRYRARCRNDGKIITRGHFQPSGRLMSMATHAALMATIRPGSS